MTEPRETRILEAVVTLVDSLLDDFDVVDLLTELTDIQAVAQRWPRFAVAAGNAGFSSVHAVPMRAGKTVLGAMGLFGNQVGELNEADQLVGQTLTHIACVAILQERAPTGASVLPRLQYALECRVAVEQAKGFLRERLDVSVETAFTLLRHYGRMHGEHMTAVASRLLSSPTERQPILDAMARLLTP